LHNKATKAAKVRERPGWREKCGSSDFAAFLFEPRRAIASLLMSILIFGTSLRSDWSIVGVQMIYAIVFFIALFFLEHNHYSFDRLLRREEA
jgi:hypothetical protein